MSQYSGSPSNFSRGNDGASFSQAEEDEICPLIEEDMKDQLGVSSVTLVSQGSNKAARLPQYVVALVVTIGGFGAGTILGWSSPAEPRLKTNSEYGFPISSASFSWISSIIAVGAIIASPFVGWLVEVFGRKTTIVVLCIPSLVGWALVIWAESVLMFCIGRFIMGMAAGGWCIVVPLYTSEMCEVDIRGILGTYFQLQISSGILFVYIVGTFVKVFWLSVTCGAIIVVYSVLMLFLPESPTFYLKKNEVEKSRAALQFFRGKDYDVSGEIKQLQRNIDEMVRDQVPIMEAFRSIPAKKGLIIGIGLMFYQQFSGINGVIFYTTSIFKEAGSTLDSSIQTIIVGTVMTIATYISSHGIDRYGRRPLLLVSTSMMALSTLSLGAYFYFATNGADVSMFNWVPIASLCVFLITFALGFGPIPWMYLSEVMSRQIAGYACSIVCIFNWSFVFLVTRFFPVLKEAIGFAGAFWVFSFLSITGIFFVWFLIPETKGKTLEEMIVKLGGQPVQTLEDGNKPPKI